jgi:hypothetical protein
MVAAVHVPREDGAGHCQPIAEVTVTICPHAPGSCRCREIVVAFIAQQLRSIPEESRCGVCVEALKLARAVTVTTPEAAHVEEMIG